jgi:hypothetical protein
MDIKNILGNYIFQNDDNPENISIRKITKDNNTNKNITDSEKPKTIKKFLTASSLYDLQNIINPSSRYKKNYLVLDSRYRIQNNSITHFSWRYVETANNEIGFVNSIGTIQNIVSMRLSQATFGFADIINTVDYTSEYRNTNRVSVFINEFYSQSFISDADTNYHWILRIVNPVDTGTYTEFKSQILQTEHFNDGVFNFVKPITKLDTLTITFADPVNYLRFFPDRMKIKFDWSAPTNATLNFIYVDPSIDLRYYRDTMIFITGFTTATPTNENDAALISFINSPFGFKIMAVADRIDPLTIPASILALTVNPIADLEIEAYFALSRFILPIEFTYFTT